MSLKSLSLLLQSADLLLILASLVLERLQLSLSNGLQLNELSSLGSCLVKATCELVKLLLIVLLLRLEDKGCIVLEGFLRHLLEALNSLRNLIDVLHEGFRHVVSAHC